MNYFIFIDESCHLEHDNYPVMCIGYIKVPQNDYQSIKNQIIETKIKYKSPFEIKWQKFSQSRIPLYKELIDIFFDSPMEFRCILVKYKERLNHEDYNQGSHDNYYYKLIYYLLYHNITDHKYLVYLDIKDFRGKEKLLKIDEIFDNKYYGASPFIRFQHIRSHENVFIQITDLFIGAVTYKTRVTLGSIPANSKKMELIEYIEYRSGFFLDEGTAPWESKFNIFDHQPRRK